MTCRRSPCTFSSRVIGRSSQSGPLQGVVTLGTIGQMALTVSDHKCQHYSDSVHSRGRHLSNLQGHPPSPAFHRTCAARRRTLGPCTEPSPSHNSAPRVAWGRTRAILSLPVGTGPSLHEGGSSE